jgi:hypothetical protein
MPCQNVANMQHMTPKFLLVNVNFHQRVSIYFIKYDYLDQKKWEGTKKMEKILLGYWHMSTQVKNYNQHIICFKGHFIPINVGIKKSNCLLLCTTTIYGISKVCSKFVSLGSNPNSFYYTKACGHPMHC